MKVIVQFITILLLTSSCQAMEDKKIVLQMNSKTYEYSQQFSQEDIRNKPDKLNVVTGKIISFRINKKKEIIVIKTDNKKSDIFGIVYLEKTNNKTHILDFILENEWYQDVISVDINSDGISELVSYWEDELYYGIRIDQLVIKNDTISIREAYKSPALFVSDYGRKRMIVGEKGISLFYYYNGVIKRGLITVDKNDPTGEPYLKPMEVLGNPRELQ